jgi:hypothetical protein
MGVRTRGLNIARTPQVADAAARAEAKAIIERRRLSASRDVLWSRAAALPGSRLAAPASRSRPIDP